MVKKIHKIPIDRSIAEGNAELIKEWHPTKNRDLTPYNVTPGSHKKVWWLCLRCKESYKSKINKRTSGQKCPYCSNQKVCQSNCLATKNPKLAKEWHPTKNKNLTPYNIVPGSHKKAWWLCPVCEESYCSMIKSRNNGHSCPFCNSNRLSKINCLAVKNPKISKEWHPIKNYKLTPFDVTPCANKKVWWLCSVCKKSYYSKIYNRNNGSNCPYCRAGKTEAKCKFIIELLTEQIFESGNTSLLNNGQHLDIYCSRLGLAVEYQGEQHYKYMEHWHKNKKGFTKQKRLDRQKIKIVGNIIKNFKLKHFFEIPYWETKNDNQLVNFIKNKLEEVGISTTNKIDLNDFYNNYSGLFVNYKITQKTARDNHIKTSKEYYKEYKKYSGLPCNPEIIYKNQWKGWYSFLGATPPQSRSEAAKKAWKTRRKKYGKSGINKEYI